MKQYISFLLLVFTGLACWSCKDDVERPALCLLYTSDAADE